VTEYVNDENNVIMVLETELMVYVLKIVKWLYLHENHIVEMDILIQIVENNVMHEKIIEKVLVHLFVQLFYLELFAVMVKLTHEKLALPVL
jgi:hypothetical protein